MFSPSIASNLLFLDVETVSLAQTFDDLDAQGKALWSKKAAKIYPNYTDEELSITYSNRAGIYAEFSKVVCISVGYLFEGDDEKWEFRLKSFAGEDEAKILKEFADLLGQHYYDVTLHGLCGHNIREFDIPFLSRRMLVHHIKLPAIMDIRHAKPWEREHLIDTLQDWKFGDYKNYTSLDSLCYTFGIQSPKEAMSGADVHSAYYDEKNLNKIAIYCEEDVKATMRVYLRLQNVDYDTSLIESKSRTEDE